MATLVKLNSNVASKAVITVVIVDMGIAIVTLDILVSIAKCLLHARKAAVVMVNV